MKNYSLLLSVFLLFFSWNISAQSFLGQWSQNDNQFLEITTDGLSFFYLNDSLDCFDVDSFTYYMVQPGAFVLTIEGIPLSVPFSLNAESTVLILTTPEGLDTFTSDVFVFADSVLCSSIDDSTSQSWTCYSDENVTGCLEVEGGEFSSAIECYAFCNDTDSLGWSCISELGNSNCFEQAGGEYASYEECFQICGDTILPNSGWGCFIYLGNSFCLEVAGGSYSTQEECQEVCTNQSDGSWSCFTFDGNTGCVEAIGGEYASEQDCQVICNPTDGTWNCISVGGFSGCVEALEGEFDSEEACLATCVAETDGTWDCVTLAGFSGCVEALEGEFDSEEACLQVCVTSIDSYEIGVTISPNPFDNKTLLKFTDGVQSYQLIDLTGRVILDHKVEDKQVYLYKNNLSNGIYILQLVGNDKFVREKVIID